MELCVPIATQIKTEECSNCTLTPFLLHHVAPQPVPGHATQQRVLHAPLPAKNYFLTEPEPRVSRRWGTRPKWIRTWPEGVTSPCTRTEKSVGHNSATCLKKEEKKINTCLKLTTSNQPKNDLFGTRQGRIITQTMGSKCAKYECRGLSGLHTSSRLSLSVKQDTVIVCDLCSWRCVGCRVHFFPLSYGRM